MGGRAGRREGTPGPRPTNHAQHPFPRCGYFPPLIIKYAFGGFPLPQMSPETWTRTSSFLPRPAQSSSLKVGPADLLPPARASLRVLIKIDQTTNARRCLFHLAVLCLSAGRRSEVGGQRSACPRRPPGSGGAEHPSTYPAPGDSCEVWPRCSPQGLLSRAGGQGGVHQEEAKVKRSAGAAGGASGMHMHDQRPEPRSPGGGDG